MVKQGDLFGLTYYEYGADFFGSIKGMRYKVARFPKKDVHFDKVKEPAEFEVIIWRGPYAYDRTEEEKETKLFPFTEEGMEEVIAYLNSAYDERKEYWEDQSF